MSKLSLKTDSGVALVQLDDGKANAINGDLLTELDAALDEIETGKLPIVLAGRPGFFSGGLDLKTLPRLGPDDLMATLKQFGDVMMRLFALKRPLVAACTGHAIAGGMVMMLTCDERIGCAGKFRLGLNETQIGLTLPRFVIEMARCQLPQPVLHEVIVRGELFEPDAAQARGLVDEVVDPDAVVARAIQRARDLAVLPRESFANNKTSVRSSAAAIGRDAYPKELEAFTGYFAKNAPQR